MSGTHAQFLVEGAAIFCLDTYVRKAKAWYTSNVKVDVYQAVTCAVIRITFKSPDERSIYTEDFGIYLGLNPMRFESHEVDE